jgi:capsular exopolysaccharide synthesis family protein
MEKLEELIDNLEKQDKEKTRNEYLRILRRWPWFVVSCIVALAIAIALYKKTPEKYLVQTRLFIYGEQNTLSSELNFEEQKYFERPNISDQIGVLQSYSIFRQAIDNLGWKTTWYKKGLLSKTELYKSEPFDVIVQEGAANLTSVPIQITALNDKEYLVSVNGKAVINGVEQNVQFSEKAFFNLPFRNEYFNFALSNKSGNSGEKYEFVFNRENLMTAAYQKKVTLTANAKESQVVIIESQGSVPQKEADFLNELNKVFIQAGMEKVNSTSSSSVSFIEKQIEEVKETLKVAEEKLNAYRSSNQLMNLGQEANMVYSKLGEAETNRNEVDQLLQYYTNLKSNIGNSQQISQIGNPPFMSESTDGLTNQVNKLKDLYNRREVLKMTVKEKSPNYVQIEKEISLTRKGAEELLNNLIASTEREKQNADSRVRSTQSRLATLPSAEKNLINMQRDFDVNNELYNFLLKKKAEAAISQASIAPQAKIIDPALAEYATRLGPNLMLYLFAGLFAGLIFPLLLILILAVFKNKIESIDEIEAKLEIEVLDEIIHHKYKSGLPVLDFPQSGISESFRNLKVKMLNRITEAGSKVISINSLIAGEGKSFISANFAAILSMSNKRVLLVGTDMRNPKLHSYLGPISGKGLSDYLNNEADFNEIIKTTKTPLLFLVQAGELPKNPSELLENGRFAEFIESARNFFDYIVLDNAPMLLVSDANWTIKFADINLFVLRINYSRRDETKDINKIVRYTQIQNAFVIVNDTPHKSYTYASRYWKKGYGNHHSNLRVAR